jgi:peroxiredoxin
MKSQFIPMAMLIAIFFLSSLSLSPTIPQPNQAKVDNFGLFDHAGDFHQLYYYSDMEAVVLFVQGNGCPIVRNSLEEFKAIEREYSKKGIQFFMLNANLQDDRSSIAKESKEFGIDIPILVDDNQLVAEALDIHRTAEAIVIRPGQWEIAYRGPINDKFGYESQREEASEYYLRDALDAMLSDEKIDTPQIPGKGCLVALPGKNKEAHASISYTKEIAPILMDKCMNCHYNGGIAPFAMTRYEIVRGWAPMMREVIRTRRMPPWQADPEYGHFEQDLSLTDEEISTLVHWIEAGAPRDEGPDPLKSFEAPSSEWELGAPDLEIELNKQDIPANGLLDYRYDTVELTLEQDMWATGVEFIPGNRKVLHHILINVKYPEGVKPPMEVEYEWLDGIFAAYAPGMAGEQFPAGTGRFLPKGSSLVFQIHYTTYGRKDFDISRVGIHLQKEKPAKDFLIVGPFNPEFEIPPFEKNYPVQVKKVFDREVSLYGMFPHMHFRGKSFKFTAQFPDGSEQVLLNVPQYNFNWQRFYTLKEPVTLPAGTSVLCEAIFDNSAQNPFNPSPKTPIRWGEQSFDEMMIGYMSFHYGKPKKGASE